MIAIEVNNRKLQAEPGEMLLSALRRGGIHVPTLCHMAELSPTGACRLCVVEVAGQRSLLPSCAFPVSEGMQVQTHSPRVMRARKTVVELLLANHPDDCLYCLRNGHCQLQELAEAMGVRERRYVGGKNDYKIDTSSQSIVRDPAKCVLCGKCVRVCEETQAVSAVDFIGRGSSARVGTAFNEGLNVSRCINCGQCVMVCPTGALREQSHIKEVTDAISDPARFVVVQHAPSASVSLAEELGLKAGQDVAGLLVAALRALGFDRVFETACAADLTVMEEAAELVARIRTGGALPLLSSCSPGWIKFVEHFHGDFLEHLSTCKSPQQMLGAIIKSYYCQREGLKPQQVYSVSIMPCTAKKFEAQRPEMLHDGVPDVDAVLTTRELVRMIRLHGLNLDALEPDSPDAPFGRRSTAGKLLGASGGAAEAAIRTAHFMLTGREMEHPRIPELRGLKPVKEARVKIGQFELGVAVVSGLSNAARLLEEIRAGRKDLHLVEVMSCPGGCVAGGGQPRARLQASHAGGPEGSADAHAVRQRMQALYNIDRDERLRVSHRNEDVQRLYEEFLGQPLSQKSHHLLHTRYERRELA